MTSVLFTQLHKERLSLSFTTTFKFVVLGVLWIVLSDLALFITHMPDANHFPIFHLEVLKGIFFVLMMGVFIFLMLKKQHAQIQSFSEQEFFLKNPQAMLIFDLASEKFLEINEAAVNTFGYTRSQFLSMSISDIRMTSNFQIFNTLVQELKNGNRSSDQSQHLTRNGTKIDTETFFYSIVYGSHHAGLLIINDITNQIEAEKALIEATREHEKNVNNRLYELALMNKELQIRIREVNANNDDLIEVNALLQSVTKKVSATYSNDLEVKKAQTSWLMQNVSDAVWSIDLVIPDESYLSDSARKLFMCDREMIVRDRYFWKKIVAESDLIKIDNALDEFNSTKQVEVQYLSVSNEVIWQKMELIMDENVSPLKIVGIARKISSND